MKIILKSTKNNYDDNGVLTDIVVEFVSDIAASLNGEYLSGIIEISETPDELSNLTVTQIETKARQQLADYTKVETPTDNK
jgi:hypothetical protein